MEDFFYTILVIAWIAYGIYSSVKKNKPVAPPKSTPYSQTNSNENPLEAVFQSLFQENARPQEAPIPYAYAEDEIDEAVLDSVPMEEQPHNFEEESLIDTVAIQEEPILDTYSGTDQADFSIYSENDGDINMIADSAIKGEDMEQPIYKISFNLRQAVIAQAILERPYK